MVIFKNLVSIVLFLIFRKLLNMLFLLWISCSDSQWLLPFIGAVRLSWLVNKFGRQTTKIFQIKQSAHPQF